MPPPGTLHVRALGHVSLFVRDLDATRRFYRDVLGLAETGTGKNGRIVFFSAGLRHHDISCELARSDGPGPQPKGVPGLYHIAFTVEDLDATTALLGDRLGGVKDAVQPGRRIATLRREAGAGIPLAFMSPGADSLAGTESDEAQ